MTAVRAEVVKRKLSSGFGVGGGDGVEERDWERDGGPLEKKDSGPSYLKILLCVCVYARLPNTKRTAHNLPLLAQC